jgi:arylamine N-acetyltransferase
VRRPGAQDPLADPVGLGTAVPVSGSQVGLGASGVVQQAWHVTAAFEQAPVEAGHSGELAGRVTGGRGQIGLLRAQVGGDGLLEPIPMRPGQPVRQGAGAWEYTLAEHGAGVLALRSLRPQGWLELYTFTLEARWPVGYTVFNWYTSTHPRSPFTQRPVIQRVGDNLRRSVVGSELAVIRPGWARDTRAVVPGGLPEIVAAEFGIELTAQDADTLRHL